MDIKYSKDGITVAAVLDNIHPKKNGLCPVRIRVTYRRVRKYYPTGKELTPEDWGRLATVRTPELKEIRESVINSFDIIKRNVEALASDGIFSFNALDRRLGLGCPIL